MKKLILVIMIGFLTNSIFCQLDPLDEIKLRNSISLINDFPGSEWYLGNDYVSYLENNSVSKIKYPNQSRKTTVVPGYSLTDCKCVATADAYIEFGDAGHNDFSNGNLYVPQNTNQYAIATQQEYEDFTFDFYKKLINKMLGANIDYTSIIKIEIDRGLEPRSVPQSVNVGTVKVWYKKCIKYDCEFYGM
jgi:hypothetical protein